jgi:hypothetical protein
MVRIYPLLGNGCVFYGSASRLYEYKWSSRKSEVSRRKRTRMERVLGSQGRTVRLKIDCDYERL